MGNLLCAEAHDFFTVYTTRRPRAHNNSLAFRGWNSEGIYHIFIYIYIPAYLYIYIYDLLMALGKIMGLQQLEMLNFKHVIFSTTVSIYTKDFLASWAFRRHGWAAAQKTQSSGLKVKDR